MSIRKYTCFTVGGTSNILRCLKNYTSTDERLIVTIMDEADKINIDNVVMQITKDPECIGKIVSSVKDNPELFSELLAKVDKDPSLKSKVIAAATSNSKTVKSIRGMSTKEKNEMVVNMEMARASMRQAMVDCIRVAQNGQLKKYKMPGNFPKETIFETGDKYSLHDGIVVFTTTSSRQKNKIATKMINITDVDVFGEIVIIKQNSNGRYIPFTMEEAESMKKLASGK